MDLKTYQELSRLKAAKQSEVDRLTGAAEQTLLELQKEFGCKDLKAAKVLLAQLEEDEEEAQQHYQTLLNKFEDKWSHVLSPL